MTGIRGQQGILRGTCRFLPTMTPIRERRSKCSGRTGQKQAEKPENQACGQEHRRRPIRLPSESHEAYVSEQRDEPLARAIRKASPNTIHAAAARDTRPAQPVFVDLLDHLGMGELGEKHDVACPWDI